MVPHPRASTPSPHLLTRCAVTGHASLVPPMSREPLAQQIFFLRASHGPSLLDVPPPPRETPRPPSTLGKSTPSRRVPIGTARQGGVREKPRYRTTTKHHYRRCCRSPPLRPSQRVTPLQGDPRAIAGDGVLAAPRAHESSYYAAFLQRLFLSSPRRRRDTSPLGRRDPLGPVAVSL
jgi:hypothetical protein